MKSRLFMVWSSPLNFLISNFAFISPPLVHNWNLKEHKRIVKQKTLLKKLGKSRKRTRKTKRRGKTWKTKMEFRWSNKEIVELGEIEEFCKGDDDYGDYKIEIEILEFVWCAIWQEAPGIYIGPCSSPNLLNRVSLRLLLLSVLWP